MTTPRPAPRWPLAGLGLIAGAAAGIVLALMLDLPQAICLVAGAALGLVLGAALAGRPRPS